MTDNRERSSIRLGPWHPRMYSPELQLLLQSLLATLADIDFAHESDIETVRTSSAEDWLKQATIRKLQQRSSTARSMPSMIRPFPPLTRRTPPS